MEKTSKRWRFVILLVVLGICLAFLRPTINWYFRTSEADQKLALQSLEKIKEYSVKQAAKDVKALEALAASNPNADFGEEYAWLLKTVKKNFKEYKKAVPEPLTLGAALSSFSLGRVAKNDEERKNVASSIHSRLLELFQDRYREKVLADKRNYTNSVKLGLDLSGGMNIIVHADLDAAVKSNQESVAGAGGEAAFKARAMEQAIETLKSRIDRFGLTEPVIRQQGEDRIYIEIPGSEQSDAINTIIMGKGILNFRLVDEEATNQFLQRYYSNPDATFDENGKLLDPSIVPEDVEIIGYYTKDSYGLDEFIQYMALKKEIALDGRYVKSAEVSRDQMGQTGVDFTLDMEGAEIFANFTGDHVGERLAVVSDNKVKSAATIKTKIGGGRVRIDGFGLEEAQNLQKVLQTAWLEVPLSVESQQVIGAELGELTIRNGLMALAIGLLAIFVFMLLYYKGAGINAIVAQVLNLYILFAVLSAFNLTLTLPSIAGMILTVGMAVDANVIIFERIKEELRLGKSRAAAIEAGFQGASWAIWDSNITTFIAAMFLSQLGTGSIQGFAVSLAIGVASSVFTALFVSRLMFDVGTEAFKRKTTSISWRVK
ncbi:MAG: protein translocase subunit SecD [Treponema sp.]|nr:protein translocase subunit SecD [Treponema sp.]MEE3436046.1 protein translocase subunit SecD [Treponema sp.]